MPKRHSIYVYPYDCEDFTTTGMVGDIQPLEAIFKEEKNGVCEIVMKLPYDQYERWKACKIGNLIKAEVPVRVPPVIEDDEYATSTQVMRTT